ncbi:polymorphic toxin-type HINT domain-containing protein [Actinokineospora pegani]|uniref:polymorphic toxin-type HINT domain-containing protein n=1 Tax=Actinokineospora pegani TaxID=2654637 RepID=UPI0012EA9E3D|nr:LamG-like jellyroll fold domain-containing protein [Actinokineospora pegani]
MHRVRLLVAVIIVVLVTTGLPVFPGIVTAAAQAAQGLPPQQRAGHAAGRSHESPAGEGQSSDPAPVSRPEAVGAPPMAPDPVVPGSGLAEGSIAKSTPVSNTPDMAKAVEDTGKRTAQTTEFAHPDGSRTLRTYSSTRYAPDAKGKLEPADTTLRRTADGRIAPKLGSGASFADKGDKSGLLVLDVPGGRVEMALVGAKPVSIDVPDLAAKGVGDGKASFREIREHSDLALTAATWGIKEDIVLKSPQAPKVWDFAISTTGGLKPELDKATGAVFFLNPKGERTAVIPPGFMVDSAIDPRSGEGVRSNGVGYSLVQVNGATVLRVEFDQAWLADPARKYPVVVDPTLRSNPDADDTYVMSGFSPFASLWEPELKVGTYDGGAHVAASFIHFNQAFHNLRNHMILGSSLSVHEVYSYCCPAQARDINVYRVTAPWGAEVDRWPGPAYDGNRVGYATASYGNSPGWITMQLPAQGMTRWVHGLEPFHGFRLGASSTDTYAWKRLSSAQSPQPNNVPFLDVWYTPEGATYGVTAFSTGPTSQTEGVLPVQVTNWGTATWPAASGGAPSSFVLRQSIYNSANQEVISGMGASGLANYSQFNVTATTGPHQTTTVNVRVPKLPPGPYRMVLGMTGSGSHCSHNCNYSPFQESPRQEVHFTVPNTPPTIDAQHPPNNASVDTLTPTLWSRFVDPDGTPNGIQHYLYRVCGGLPSAPVGCVESGWRDLPTWQVPSGPLSWSKMGHWSVKLSDGATESGWIGAFALTPVVPQPAIASKLVGTPDGGDLPGVNPLAGNFGSSVTDVSVSVGGPPLAVTRTYNSQDPRTTGAFGAGWTTPFDQRLTEEAGTGNVVATLVTGLQVRFGRNPDASYAPPPGLNLTLVKSGTEWVLRDAKGNRRTFDAQGRLIRTTDASGNTQTVLYASTSAQIDKIRDDASGRQLHLTWSGGHVVSAATDAPSTGVQAPTWTYTYSGDKLTTVCAPLQVDSCTSYDHVVTSHYRATVLDDNPTAYWTLGEATGATANSQTGVTAGEWNATYQGVVQAQPGAIAGSTDTSAKFDAATPGGVVSPKDLLNKSMGYSVEVWFKADYGKNGVLVGEQNTDLSGQPTNYTPWLYISSAGKLRGNAFTTAGVHSLTTANRVDDGQWHHAVFTGSVDAYTLYLDGAQAATGTGGAIDHQTADRLVIGNGRTAGWPDGSAGAMHPFTGHLDEVAAYRHALIPAKVAAHHSARTTTNRLSKVTEPGNFAATQITYDGQGGRVGSLTDRHGATWTVGLAVPGPEKTRSVELTSTIRTPITYVYDAANGNRITERRDSFGTTAWGYNAAGFVHTTRDPSGWTTYTDTDARGNVIRAASWYGVWGYRGYAYFNNPADPLDPRNDTLLWQTNGQGWGDEEAHKTKFTVDAGGRVVKIVYPKPAGVVTNPEETFTYATGPHPAVDGGNIPLGKPIIHTDTRGKATTHYYYRSGDLGAVIDPAGLRHEHGYDALGRVQYQKQSARTGTTWTTIGTTTFAYNALSQQTQVTEPAVTNPITNVTHRAVTTSVYDRSGRRTQQTVSDATGGDPSRATSYGYDAAGRLTTITAPDQSVTTREWDTAGDLVKTTDAGGRVLERQYDDRHLLVETVAVGQGVDPFDPASTRLVIESRAYDPHGRVTSVVDAQGRERELSYHGHGPVSSIHQIQRDQNGAVVNQEHLRSWEYNGAGKPVEQWEGRALGTQTLYVYDDAGLLQAEAVDPQNSPLATTYTRDAAGNPLTVTTHSGAQFNSLNFNEIGYLGDNGGSTSQKDPLGARYADGANHIDYEFAWPRGDMAGRRNLTGAKITLRLSNQYLVETSVDGTNWVERARETQDIRDHSNLAELTFDVSNHVSTAHNPLRIRVRDSQPANGWGGRVLSGRVEFHDSSAPPATTRYGYDDAGRLISSTVDNPGGTPTALTTTQTRDARGLVTALTDPTGATTDLTWDTLGRSSTAKQPAVDTVTSGVVQTAVRPTATSGYNTFGELTRNKDANGAVTTRTWDVMGRMTGASAAAYTPPGGSPVTSTTSAVYDSRGLRVEATDPRGGVTSTQYDYYGRPAKVTGPDPDGTGPKPRPETGFAYDRVGQLLRTTDPTGAVSESTYDEYGNEVTSTAIRRTAGAPLVHTTTFEYDELDRLIKQTSPGGQETTMRFDDRGDIEGLTLPSGVFQYWDYDHAGRLQSTMLDDKYLTLYNRDGAGRVVSETDHVGSWQAPGPALRTRSSVLDAAGRATQSTTAAGRVSRSTFDAAGRTSSLTQFANGTDPASASTVQLRYDAAGNRTRMIDPNGNSTDYTYNSWNLPESLIEPSTPQHPNATDRTWTTTYDAMGNPVSEVGPGGVSTQRTFDGLNRLVNQTGSGATAAKSFDYDAAGRPVRFSGPTGDTTVTWDDRAQLVGLGGAAGTATYEYDADGRMTKRTDRAGVANYTYNANGLLGTSTDPLSGRTLAYAYDDDARLTSITQGAGGAVRQFGYDDFHRVTSETTKAPGGATTASTATGFDLDGLITSETVTGMTGTGANTYTYDGMARLTGHLPPTGNQVTYGWDKSSNRTSVTTPSGTTTAVYDARNRLVSDSSGRANTHTPRGTLATSTLSGVTTTLQHDAFDRMTSATKGGQTSTYAYDALDRVATRNGSGFAYADLQNSPVGVPNGVGENLFSRGVDGAPLTERTAAGVTRNVLAAAARGDVLAGTDPATGAVSTSTDYTPFGEPTGTGDRSPLGFQGGYTDPVTGQVNAHSRWYDPATGVFTSRDTWTLDPYPVVRANRYTYGDAAPTTVSDPSGHCPPCVIMGIAWAAHGLVWLMENTGQDPDQPPAMIQTCSNAQHGCGGSGAYGAHRQGERDFTNSQNNGKNGGSKPGGSTSGGGSGRGSGGSGGGGGGSGGGSTNGKNGKNVKPAAPPPPPVAVVNNNTPTPRPATEQTLNGGRPIPTAPTTGTPVTVPAVDAVPASYVPIELVTADQGCDWRCQTGGFVQGLLVAGKDAVVGTADLAVDFAQCSPAWAATDAVSACVGNAVTIASVTDAAVDDPVDFAGGVWDGMTQDIRNAWNDGRYGEAAGLASFELIDLLIGSHGATKARHVDKLPCVGGGNSFPRDTPVLMADGTNKPIAEVKPGDKVMATDPATGVSAPKVVTATKVTDGQRLMVGITTAEGTVTATDDHPFWLPRENRWTNADELKAGDWLWTSAGTAVQITAIHTRYASQRVHNFTVEGLHTYYVLVGETPVLTHNEDPCVNIYKAAQKGMTEKILRDGFQPEDFPRGNGMDGKAYFGVEKSGKDIALKYASHGTYDDEIIQVTIPKDVYDAQFLAHQYKYEGREGQYEVSIPQELFPILNQYKPVVTAN